MYRIDPSSIVRLNGAAASVNVIRSSCMHVSETFKTMLRIGRAEGVGALWRGVGATMVGVIPARAVYFSTYTHVKSFLHNQQQLMLTAKTTTQDSVAVGGRENESPWVHLGGAVAAGLTVATLTNPIWMLKTRMQLEPNPKGNWHCILGIVRQEGGIKGLYKGMSASYLGVIEGTLQWLMYEQMKRKLAVNRRGHSAALAAATDSADAGSGGQWGQLFGAAAVSKFIAAIVAYPHEVLRTRLREVNPVTKHRRYKSLLQASRLILREEGWKAFYGGMTAHLLRVVPNSAIMFFSYELLLHSYAALKTGQ